MGTRTDEREIRVDITGGIAVITLDAPERRNALTPSMARELIVACEQVDAHARSVRA